MRFSLAVLLVLAVALLPGCAVSAVLSADAGIRFPDVGSHVAVDGMRLRYVERGEGQAIVLLHGVFGGLEDFGDPLLAGFAERGRAIAFDRPGHGWSSPECGVGTPLEQAAILRDACRAIGASRPVLVGFSWGGSAAAAWAAAWPDEVQGLVLLSAPTHEWGGAPVVIDVLATLPVLGDFLTANVFAPIAPLVVPLRRDDAFAPDAVPESYSRSSLPLALRPADLQNNCAELRLLDGALAAQSPSYGRITCKTVFVVGSGDRIVGPEFHSPRFLEQVPTAERVVIPNAGHQLLYVHPEACLDALDRLLAARR